MTDDSDVGEVDAQLVYNLSDIQVVVACPGCGWNGIIRLYNIGDGPEWCCPSCDTCWPSQAEIGADGLSKAERNLRAVADEHRQHRGEQ